MKVTFIYTDYGQFNTNNFNRGVAILSACLRQKGYLTSLIHISKKIEKNELITLVKIHQPDILAFSSISNMFSQIKMFSSWLNNFKIPTLYGGMHPTIAPEECLKVDGINAICRGEGEEAIVDFCQAIEKGMDIKHILNIWVKKDNQIYKNTCRNLIENLDSLPYPDYELFEYQNLDESRLHKALVTQASRGCVYNCTYCCNHSLRSLYPNKEKFLRHYSVDRILDEIEWALKKYPLLKEVKFYDDTLTQDKNWFREFTAKYKSRIGLPYSSNERVENIDSGTARDLKESGCISLDLGIESGSRFIREIYMNRWMSDDKIIKAFSLLRSCGIRTNSFNILGMVGETPQTILETVKLNAWVKPFIVFNAYFYPFRGTRAYDFICERSYSFNEEVRSFFEKPVVKLDTISQSQLNFYYKYFYSLMRLYRLLWKIFKKENMIVKIFDKIITSRYFPYFIFNFLHFGKEDILILLRRYPELYIFLRRIYRFIRHVEDHGFTRG